MLIMLMGCGEVRNICSLVLYPLPNCQIGPPCVALLHG